MPKTIHVIDLFAGPGGLGEGFASILRSNKRVFKTVASVEKDAHAHATLTLRAFFRQFPVGKVPDDYYGYLSGKIKSSKELYDLYPKEAENAKKETLGEARALGPDNELIKRHIDDALMGGKGPRVVIGGPPCQAYSLAGRAKNLNNPAYKEDEDHRHTLYKEYLAILAHVEPEVFVMENVRGILSSKYGGKRIFPVIMDDLKNPQKALNSVGGSRYKIYSLVERNEDLLGEISSDGKSTLIAAEDYGVPQARHRVILLGVRADLDKVPSVLRKRDRITVDEVIRGLPKIRAGFSESAQNQSDWFSVVKEFTKEIRDRVEYDFINEAAQKVLETITDLSTSGGRHVAPYSDEGLSGKLKDWLYDPKLTGFSNHDARPHMVSDLQRYMFASLFADSKRDRLSPSPKAKEYPRFLAPNHKNWDSGDFVDRFKVQASWRPANTITNHISKDGHYFIHPDPLQCRSLTVREAARIQTFPDNYFFEGPRTSRYGQVGNAVPPLLAKQIGEIVYDLLR